jgi:hypothetical protein
VVNQTLVFQIKLCGASPALRVAAKRSASVKILSMKKIAIILILLIAQYSTVYCQLDSSIQNDTIVHIDNVAEIIDKEELDTLTLKNLVLHFDTIFVVESPVPKNTHIDSNETNILVFYNENGIRKFYVNETWYYFENKKLIKTHLMCMSSAFMGLCNGLYSEYKNYFVNSSYFKTIEGFGMGQCHCSDNVILDSDSIEKIIFTFNRQ